MLWFALHLPLLSLEAFCATLAPDQQQRPAVLLAEHRVSHVNQAAAERGVKPGMKRATAMALAGDLLVAEADPARDAAALQAVAHAALAFTPSVTLHDTPNNTPNNTQTVLLEVQASLRLFGGAAALRQRLLAAVAPLGHAVCCAAAPTAQGAALLVRWRPDETAPQSSSRAPGSLKPHSKTPGNKTPSDLPAHATDLKALQAVLNQAPVWLLGPGREHWEALQGMGLHTLSDLRQLPRSGLARRFGEGLMGDLDRALGLQPDPRIWVTLPAIFESRLELYARAENTDQVLAAAAVLLTRLVAWAQARHARVAAFTLAMQHERNRNTEVPPTELRIELAEPALDAAHLQLLLRERLGRAELAAPTLELRLHCHHTVAGHAPNGELFPTRASAAEGLTRLLERLRARLGDAQVQRLVPVADHRPEGASRSVPAHGSMAAGPALMTESALPLHRPAWLLPEPLPLAEKGAMPLLQGRPLQLLSGPERIETGWWDEHPVARDYFIAQSEDASLVWVFRERIPRHSEAGEANWFLQGRFA
jgi:protein ImuB